MIGNPAAPAASRGPAAAIAIYATAWAVVPALTNAAPPLDVVEGYAFGRSGLLVTHEHPNLPGLLLAGLQWLGGAAGWPAYALSPYALSAAAMVATLFMVRRLGRDLLGEPAASVGTLFLLTVFYFQWPIPEWNHNVAQVPLWAAVSLSLWRAVTTGRRRWWLALGLAGGLALWAKYAAVVLLGVAALYIVSRPLGRRRLATAGPWLGLLVFVCVLAPQVLALAAADLYPLRYAVGRADQADAGGAGTFLLAQLADHALMLLAVAILYGMARRDRPVERPRPDKEARLFLPVMALGPVAATVAGAVITGSGLQDMWGMPMFNLSGLLAVALVPGLGTLAARRRIGLVAVSVSVLVPVLYAAHVLLPPRFGTPPPREAWPQDRIAAVAREGYRAATGKPLAAVAGTGWVAGLVALDGDEPVLVLPDSHERVVVGPALAPRTPVLVVWRPERGVPALLSEAAQRSAEQWRISWRGERLVLAYAVTAAADLNPGASGTTITPWPLTHERPLPVK